MNRYERFLKENPQPKLHKGQRVLVSLIPVGTVLWSQGGRGLIRMTDEDPCIVFGGHHKPGASRVVRTVSGNEAFSVGILKEYEVAE